jgi:hypothetical protein
MLCAMRFEALQCREDEENVGKVKMAISKKGRGSRGCEKRKISGQERPKAYLSG